MNWLSKALTPAVKPTAKKEVTSGVWVTCPGCNAMLYTKDVAENQQVCPQCGHHMKWSLQERLEALLGKSFTELDIPDFKDDPLKFKDSKKYSERLAASRKKTGRKDAARAVVGTLACEKHPQKVAVAAFDFAFMGGSMGRAVGEAVVVAAQEAVTQKIPLLVITASGGARMQEGVMSLMQMARTTAAIAEVKDAALPYIVLLCDPTTGGVTASFAMQGDIIAAEPKATIGFAGARVIQQTVGETLPEGFQTAEYLQENGMVDVILPRAEQPEKLANLFALLMRQSG